MKQATPWMIWCNPAKSARSACPISGHGIGRCYSLQQHAKPVIAWSPLGGGELVSGQGNPVLHWAMADIAKTHGTDIAAVAVAWLLAHPANITPVMGTNNLSRIASLSDALNINLSRQSWYQLYTAALGTEVP
jgi:predicted oxidoreductase